jgi:O-antigen/teichoic acid export membrane protein
VFAAAGRPLLSLFGAYYRQAFGPLLVIAASTVVTSAAGSVEIIINMSGRPHWNTANQIALLVLLVGMSRCLVPCWGVAGAAVSFSASQAAIAVLSAAEMAWFYRKDQRAAEASDR